ncbi:stage 0 sporulation family protein [Candidatus Latescibacterota bacterium]
MTLIDKEKNGSGEVKVYEVEFKGSRKDFFLSPDRMPVKVMDFLIVQADRGEHIGRFIRYLDKSIFENIKEMKSILRRATYTDIQIMMDNRHKEDEAFEVCKEKIEKHELKMKLVDVEYQFDANKICFYFTADKRIDFRDLVKDLAAEYRTRIELRQIGVRDEARRLGGLGVCGRQLCCKTFINQFETITSQMARDQNLSLSPSKISGLCGRLMCCLAFEEDFYKYQSDILPQEGEIVQLNSRNYKVTKVDIFNESFIIKDDNNTEKTVNINEFSNFKIVQPAPGSVANGSCNNKKGCNGECNKKPDDYDNKPQEAEKSE